MVQVLIIKKKKNHENKATLFYCICNNNDKLNILKYFPEKKKWKRN